MGASVLIRGGLVVDGTGAHPRTADVLLRRGRVVAVEPALEPGDAETIDAAECVVAPGFVDVHSHADFTLLAFPTAESAIMQGVTTVIVGNCGGGVAPAFRKRDVRRVAFGYSPAWGVDITWRTFAEYLATLHGAAVNVAALVPHGAVRNAVMGLEARPPDRRELARMVRLVEGAMADGAAGLSTGLEYQPGCSAAPEEIEALARVVAGRGGLYATHMRNRAEHFSDATHEALAVGRRTGVRLQLSHVAPRPYAPVDEVERAFDAIEAARGAGDAVWVDTFPETWGPGLLGDLFPRDVMRGTPRQVVRRLRHPDARRAVAREFEAERNFLVRAGGYDSIFIAAHPTHPQFQDNSLRDLARAAGQTVAEWACDAMLAAGDLCTSIAIRHVYATERDLRRVLALPYCSLGSDGVVTSGEDDGCLYPWNASSYGYAARTLAKYGREQRLFSLQDAVRRLSALPAEAAGLTDRGSLTVGKAADVVVLDLDQLVDRTADGAMARHPAGIRHVLVNGVRVVADGRPSGRRPGRLLTPG
jgi:N-acyl-D-amino-acid deacylase